MPTRMDDFVFCLKPIDNVMPMQASPPFEQFFSTLRNHSADFIPFVRQEISRNKLYDGIFLPLLSCQFFFHCLSFHLGAFPDLIEFPIRVQRHDKCGSYPSPLSSVACVTTRVSNLLPVNQLRSSLLNLRTTQSVPPVENRAGSSTVWCIEK